MSHNSNEKIIKALIEGRTSVAPVPSDKVTFYRESDTDIGSSVKALRQEIPKIEGLSKEFLSGYV